jgi:hypothetical protein
MIILELAETQIGDLDEAINNDNTNYFLKK